MLVSQIISEIDDEIERLQQARNLLASATGKNTGQNGTRVKPKMVQTAKKMGRKAKLNAKVRRKISGVSRARQKTKRKAASPRAKK